MKNEKIIELLRREEKYADVIEKLNKNFMCDEFYVLDKLGYDYVMPLVSQELYVMAMKGLRDEIVNKNPQKKSEKRLVDSVIKSIPKGSKERLSGYMYIDGYYWFTDSYRVVRASEPYGYKEIDENLKNTIAEIIKKNHEYGTFLVQRQEELENRDMDYKVEKKSMQDRFADLEFFVKKNNVKKSNASDFVRKEFDSGRNSVYTNPLFLMDFYKNMDFDEIRVNINFNPIVFAKDDNVCGILLPTRPPKEEKQNG